jgi:signal transduction histidine kinase
MRAKQMLATMSHEIRSPLSGVVSMAEVLATTNLDTEQRQLVDVMVSSGDLVLQLINDILDFSKVQSGKSSQFSMLTPNVARCTIIPHFHTLKVHLHTTTVLVVVSCRLISLSLFWRDEEG